MVGRKRSTARNTAAILPNITKPANRFWSFTRQAIFRKSKILKSILSRFKKSGHRKMQNTVRRIKSPVSCPKRRGRSRNISAMNRAEDNSRSVSGTTLNDDRLSGKRKRHLEPSVAVMEKLSAERKSPQKRLQGISESFRLVFSYSTFPH